MSAQTTSYSPEFQALINKVETALIQASVDARELAERTGTPLIVRETRQSKLQRNAQTSIEDRPSPEKGE